MEKSPSKRFQSPAELSQVIRASISSSGALSEDTAKLATRIDATRTLQQLMANRIETLPRRANLWRFIGYTFPLVALGVGLWWGNSQPKTELASQLVPGNLEVRQQATVEAQYIEAARLNEPEWWMKVLEAYPEADSQVNAAYASKARIQLARLYRKRGDYRNASATLEQLLSNAELPTLYRAIALAEKLQNQQDADDATEQAEQPPGTTEARQALL